MRCGADARPASRCGWRRTGSSAVTLADGRILAGHVRSSSYVSARLTTIVWRADGERRLRSILILPDMVSADAFRRLRVMLRYARSGEVEAAPESQR